MLTCFNGPGGTGERTQKYVTINVGAPNYEVVVSNNSGSGTISGPGINCPGDCGETYSSGTWITLIATQANGYTFNGWSTGASTICGGQGSTCSALVDGNKTASANFSVIPPPFNYTLSSSGTSYVTKTSGNASTQNTITKTLTSGNAEPVDLSLSGIMPTGVSVSGISNQGCSPSPTCSSVISFSVAPNTPVGTHTITVSGSTLGKQTSFNLVVSGNPMTVTCSASPSTALLGQNVTWTATVSGGTPPLTYVWSGTDIPTTLPSNNSSYSKSYSTIGQKSATVTVTDADGLSASFTSTVQIKFDPDFEEF